MKYAPITEADKWRDPGQLQGCMAIVAVRVKKPRPCANAASYTVHEDSGKTHVCKIHLRVLLRGAL